MILEHGTATARQNDIKVVTVTVTSGTTTQTSAADATVVGGKVISCEIYPATDIALVKVIPTVSSTGVVTVTLTSNATVAATAYVAISRATGNNA